MPSLGASLEMDDWVCRVCPNRYHHKRTRQVACLMTMEDHAMTDEYDPVAMAKRIRANESRQAKTRKRQWVILAFVLFAFMLLAYRSEYTNSRITDDQAASCELSNIIIADFNLEQNRLIAIERTNMSVTAAIREARIATYEEARIIPIPSCPRRMPK